jgi:hypothetical protein
MYSGRSFQRFSLMCCHLRDKRGLKMEATCFSKMLVMIYQNTWHCNAEDCNFKSNHHEKLNLTPLVMLYYINVSFGCFSPEYTTKLHMKLFTQTLLWFHKLYFCPQCNLLIFSFSFSLSHVWAIYGHHQVFFCKNCFTVWYSLLLLSHMNEIYPNLK